VTVTKLFATLASVISHHHASHHTNSIPFPEILRSLETVVTSTNVFVTDLNVQRPLITNATDTSQSKPSLQKLTNAAILILASVILSSAQNQKTKSVAVPIRNTLKTHQKMELVAQHADVSVMLQSVQNRRFALKQDSFPKRTVTSMNKTVARITDVSATRPENLAHQRRLALMMKFLLKFKAIVTDQLHVAKNTSVFQTVLHQDTYQQPRHHQVITPRRSIKQLNLFSLNSLVVYYIIKKK